MVDSALFTDKGGRKNNEDYVRRAVHPTGECFILCDGLGGHDRGEVASSTVAEHVATLFENNGDYPDFIKDAFESAQKNLLELQTRMGLENAMKTTLVVLVITKEHVKWGHIGDSRLYHFFKQSTKYERTRDHSMVQILSDMGEISEKEIRTHSDRNKVLRVMGAPWDGKSYDLSGLLERVTGHEFTLMTDGFWEYVLEEEMMEILQRTTTSEEWLKEMEQIVRSRADMTKTDNFSCICVRVYGEDEKSPYMATEVEEESTEEMPAIDVIEEHLEKTLEMVAIEGEPTI